MAKRFESVLGKFIWNNSGWFLRVAIDEVKNIPEKGGLGLVCVSSMCNSLLASQFLRLLKSSDEKSVAHIAYWIGDSLHEFLPGIDVGTHPINIPDYYAYIESLIVLGRIDDLITPQSWRILTNKMLYKEKTLSFSVPKVESDAGFSYSRVWRRLNLPIISSKDRDIAYLLVHNKLPTQERLFRVGMVNDPYCTVCLGAVVSDVEHVFSGCVKVHGCWTLIQNEILSLIGVHTPVVDILNFFFPSSVYDNEVVWLICSYVTKVWQEIYVRGRTNMKSEELFGFLKFKYKVDQQGKRQVMRQIPGLL